MANRNEKNIMRSVLEKLPLFMLSMFVGSGIVVVMDLILESGSDAEQQKMFNLLVSLEQQLETFQEARELPALVKNMDIIASFGQTLITNGTPIQEIATTFQTGENLYIEPQILPFDDNANRYPPLVFEQVAEQSNIYSPLLKKELTQFFRSLVRHSQIFGKCCNPYAQNKAYTDLAESPQHTDLKANDIPPFRNLLTTVYQHDALEAESGLGVIAGLARVHTELDKLSPEERQQFRDEARELAVGWLAHSKMYKISQEEYQSLESAVENILHIIFEDPKKKDDALLNSLISPLVLSTVPSLEFATPSPRTT